MKWWPRALCLWSALSLLAVIAHTDSDDVPEVVVSAVTLEGDGAVLAEVVRAALSRAGVHARVSPPAPVCSRPDSSACLYATLRDLVRGSVTAALLPVGAQLPPALQLRDAGLEELGDAASPSRRTCLSSPPARSLLDLADEEIARLYYVAPDVLGEHNYTRVLTSPNSTCKIGTRSNANQSCTQETGFATILSDDPDEAALLTEVVAQWGLRAQVVTSNAHNTALPPPALRCTTTALRRLRHFTTAGYRPLAPPPCTETHCPFESRRLVKLVNARQLTRSPSAYRILGRIVFEEQELVELAERSHTVGPEMAAREFVESRPRWASPPAEVRVAVIVPATSPRQVQDARALRAAAELAEKDILETKGTLRFKVELVDGGCAATPAFKYLTDALGTEYGALSAVAGPACGAAFADVARQSPTLALPLLAYTPQAPPSDGGGHLALLTGGDARLYTDAWATLLNHFGWRRLAVLSELSMRPALEVSRLRVDNILVHVELTTDAEEVNLELINGWAERAARENARVLLVSAEDARVVRAALTAGRRAGLAACVWLLPALEPLGSLADGHFSFVPSWFLDWKPDSTTERRRWTSRWNELCARGPRGGGACLSPPATAALLYDVLQLWAAALRRLLTSRPASLDDLHRKDVVQFLVEDATKANYSGLTGVFKWTTADESKARVADLLLLQWNNGTARRVGRWHDGVLVLDDGAIRWNTTDGRAPDDGAERCALQPLADLLRADCRVAFVTVATLALALAVSALAAGAWLCKRRAEREYRARLAELGLRALVPEPGGLDKWEVPRERVVINRKLGTGAFGMVYGGHALLAEDRGWSAVAVKTLKAGATTEEKLDFLSEAEAMKRFEHKNVVRLLGVVTKTEPVCTVMEFMLYGDLKNYLLARRHLAGAGGAAAEEVSPQRLTAMALDVARALSYLAQLRYVHRDVAARNCLISANRVVKLADFGMTRLVFENDYYRFSRKGMLPVRWMAPESLALGVFSPASDVWSFGVLLYEIVTFGALPFQGLSNSEVLARVKAGHTLDLPAGLKPQLEGLMKSCWQRERRARPSAAEVAAFLADWGRLLTPCTDAPLDALSFDGEWRARGSWATPLTDTTYLSADLPRDTDAFLPS